MTNKLKKVIMLTGSGAGISQQIAIIEKLIDDKSLLIEEFDTMLVGSGTSVLNLLAINACFSPSIDYTLEEYKHDILFRLTNNNLNLDGNLPADISAFRATFQKLLGIMQIDRMDELPFRSFILTYSHKLSETIWVDSYESGNKFINLCDLCMASASIPVLFPPQKIKSRKIYWRNIPLGKFTDSSINGTFNNFEEYIDKLFYHQGPLEEIYIINSMRNKKYDRTYLPDYIQNTNVSNQHSELLNNYLKHMQFKDLEDFIAKFKKQNTVHGKFAEHVYVCNPSMEQNFPLFDFGNQEKQYHAVIEWANSNKEMLAIEL